jgi:DNA-binding XRE family transcriptional regulator
MSKKNEFYDVSAELAKEFGEVGSQSRAEATAKAWEEYNAQILLDARKNARLTQAELASRIGADKAYISRIERGITVPTVATLYKIAAAMGFTIELKPI